MEKGLTAEFTTPSLSFVQISSPTHCWLKAKGKQVVGSKQDHKKHMLMWCFGFTGSRCAREQSDMGTGKKKVGKKTAFRMNSMLLSGYSTRNHMHTNKRSGRHGHCSRG